MSPVLAQLPDHQQKVIAVGSSIRKNLPILQAFLQSLDWQSLPPNTRILPLFVPDFLGEQADAEVYLREWTTTHGGELLRGVPSAAGDFSDAGATHQWSLEATRRIAANKNRIIKRALQLNADALFLVDADLILDRTVLAQLIADEKPIVTAVYYTKWQRQTKETQKQYAMPQVWLLNPYQLSGRGMDDAEFRTKLVNRELQRVWGFGACTLIQRRVLETGLDFSPHPDAPQDGLNAWEDRQFCWKAERMHIEAWADSHPDIFHIYDSQLDVPKIPAMLQQLGANHPQQAKLGDLVSLTLEALEPVPTPRGPTIVPKQYPRGRLGQLPLMPEIEGAILTMRRGEIRTIPVHFPINHSLAYFRGRRRLIRIGLLDVKPFAAPVGLEEEIRVKAGTVMDKLLLTERQQQAVA